MSRSCRSVALALLLATFTSGCASVWHDLQPHRLRRLNRHPAPSFDPEFSSLRQKSSVQLVSLNRQRPVDKVTANQADFVDLQR
ncbi:MAG: hypothetical protein JSS49_20360 [Planctomycetes bacterium]|nr:hypothetical protein [Planctomycetota bacterium]